MGIVVTRIDRADRELVDALGGFGTATIHEAQGRTGDLSPRLRPIFAGAHVAGTAVTVSVAPADNWMIHVAVEQCQDGDLLVVSPTSRSDAGYVGELIATALQQRGVRGIVIDAGCRDVRELTAMGFPVWSRCVSVFGTVKETLGDVNIPIVCAGQRIAPGDVIVADDDGVVCVPRKDVDQVIKAGEEREKKEAVNRERLKKGELSLDIYGMRKDLEAKGLKYIDGPLE